MSSSRGTSAAALPTRNGHVDLALLEKWVPIFQEGKRIEDDNVDVNDLTPGQKRSRTRAKNRAQEASETLVAAFMPVIGGLAHKEVNRRRSWGSRVEVEDCIQFGVIGLLKGLQKFDVAKAESATNYLSQWIVTEIQRGIEPSDHDFSVPTDVGQRARRVRAIETTLASTSGETPQLGDIAAQSTVPTSSSNPVVFSKSNGKQSAAPLEEQHIRDAQHHRSRMGNIPSLQSPADGPASLGGDSGPSDFMERQASPLYEPAPAPDEVPANQWRADFLQNLIRETLIEMKLPDVQCSIVEMNYGLPPERQSWKPGYIATQVGVSTRFVERVVDAFQSHMTDPGGVFLRLCSTHSDDVLHDADLGWVINFIDRDNPSPRAPLPKILVNPPRKGTKNATPPPIPVKGEGVFVTFLCPTHDTRPFMGRYRYTSQVPENRECPSCRAASPVISIEEVS